jgi:hypothetical protein
VNAMTIERRNPLPAGHYWIEVSTDPKVAGTFQGFLDASKGFVHVDTTTQDPDFTFYVFTTTKDLIWPAGIGSPNIAAASVKARSDVQTIPDLPKEAADTIDTSKILAGVGTISKVLLWSVAAVAAYEVFKMLKDVRSKVTT